MSLQNPENIFALIHETSALAGSAETTADKSCSLFRTTGNHA
jgi:hypothetical protein